MKTKDLLKELVTNLTEEVFASEEKEKTRVLVQILKGNIDNYLIYVAQNDKLEEK